MMLSVFPLTIQRAALSVLQEGAVPAGPWVLIAISIKIVLFEWETWVISFCFCQTSL